MLPAMIRPAARTNLDARRSIVLASEVLFAVGYQTSANTLYPQDQPLEVTGAQELCIQSIYLLIYSGDCWIKFQGSTNVSTSFPLKFFKDATCRTLFLLIILSISIIDTN